MGDSRRVLAETGADAYADFLVPDLTSGHGSPVDLVVLLESPHVEELLAKHPLAGRAGRDALAFLAGNVDADRSLGEEVARRQKSGDFRVALVNVSHVPLQRQAITTPTPLNDGQWTVVEGLRRSQAREVQMLRAARRQYAEYLLSDLGRRVALLGIGSETTVAAAGNLGPDVLALPLAIADVHAAGGAAPGASPVDTSCWRCCSPTWVTQRAL